MLHNSYTYIRLIYNDKDKKTRNLANAIIWNKKVNRVWFPDRSFHSIRILHCEFIEKNFSFHFLCKFLDAFLLPSSGTRRYIRTSRYVVCRKHRAFKNNRRYCVKYVMTFQWTNEKLINERSVESVMEWRWFYFSTMILAEFPSISAPSSDTFKHFVPKLLDLSFNRSSRSNRASPCIRAESCRASVRVSDTLKCAIKPSIAASFARRTIRPLDFTNFRPARDAEMDTGQVVSTWNIFLRRHVSRSSLRNISPRYISSASKHRRFVSRERERERCWNRCR